MIHSNQHQQRGGAPNCGCGKAFDDELTRAYNEEAFRYLLEVERKRVERTSLLLLVRAYRNPQLQLPLTSAEAAAVFSALCLCIREVDFVGWFREHRIAGAVLSQGSSPASGNMPARMAERMAERVRGRLPDAIGGRLRFSVVRLQPTFTSKLK